MAGDPKYLAWVRRQACVCQPCAAVDIEANHSTVAPTFAPGEQRPKQLPGKRGKNQKSADYYAFAMCSHHHGQFHRLRGYFDGWEKKQLERWQNEQSAASRARYERRARKNLLVRSAEAPPIDPLRPYNAGDPKAAGAIALGFLALYPTIGQPGKHDLERLIRHIQRSVR